MCAKNEKKRGTYKKLVSVVVSLLMVLSIMPTGLFSITAAAATEYTDGNFKYTVDGNEATITGVVEDNMTTLTIPATVGDYEVTAIGSRAFDSCMMRAVEFPASLKTIGYASFYNCDSLLSIVIPDNVTAINDVSYGSVGTFSDCANLQTVVIGDGIGVIPEKTFSNCPNLTTVVLGDAVHSIDNRAFYNCDSLTDVWYGGANRDAITIGNNNALLTDATWHFNTCDIEEHEYVSDCDIDCESELCEWIRKDPPAEHTYDGDTDAFCNDCDFERELKNGWYAESGKWAYYKQGAKVKNDWMKDSVGWCYLGDDGYMLTNKWVQDSQGWCYVGADGYAVTNCWKRDSVGWCYLNGNGSMTKNAWVLDGGKWYYCDSNGYMLASASRYIGGKTYYFNASGVCTNP